MLHKNSCDSCRHRKLKCSREPICGSCISLGKKCIYTPRPKRTAYTKAYVDSLKHRINQLENVIEKSQLAGDVQASGVREDLTEVREDLSEVREDPNDSESDPESPPDDFLPDFINVDQLDWSEKDPASNETNENSEPRGLVDGMGALSMGQDTTTYYGATSSHGFLRFITKIDAKSLTHKVLLNRKNKKLLNSDKIDVLLDDPNHRMVFMVTFFKVFHPCYPFLDEKSIRVQYYELQEANSVGPAPPGSGVEMDLKQLTFQVLLNTILAIGSLMHLGESSVIDLLYYKRVKTHLLNINVIETGSYQLLEALVLLGNYCQKRNKSNSTWNYHGLSVRMALSFGLHKNFPTPPNSSLNTFETVERRKRLWWSLFFFDVGHSLTFGRPLHIPALEAIDIKYPLNIEDSDLANIAVITDTTSLVKTYPTIYSGIIYEAKLSKLSCMVYSKINLTEVPIKTYRNLNTMIQTFAAKLPPYFHENDGISDQFLKSSCPDKWFEITLEGDLNCPSWFSLTRRRLIWRYKNIQILMFRNLIWKSINQESEDPEMAEFINICLAAARYTIESVSNYCAHYELNTLSSWYATYFVFQSVLVVIFMIFKRMKNSLPEVSDLMELINMAKTSLESLSAHTTLCSNLIHTIESIVESLSTQGQGQDHQSERHGERQGQVVDQFSFTPTMNLFSGVPLDLAEMYPQLIDFSEQQIFNDVLENELFPADRSEGGES